MRTYFAVGRPDVVGEPNGAMSDVNRVHQELGASVLLSMEMELS